nr:cytochrome P450 [Geodermatophilaceae bacterium]
MTPQTMTPQTPDVPLEALRVADREHWADGPPLEQFARMRAQCPVHWSPGMSEFPDEPGFWSVTTQKDVYTVSRDWETYSSEVGGMLAMPARFFPVEVQNGMFIGMDPPKHDRLKALFQRGFTPRRIAEHEDEIRAITCRVLDGLEGRETVDLVADVAQPIVSRVIGSFMGIAEEDDAIWARLMNAIVSADDPEQNPDGPETVMERDMPEIMQRCQKLIADRA